jgi:hypothetical protein
LDWTRKFNLIHVGKAQVLAASSNYFILSLAATLDSNSDICICLPNISLRDILGGKVSY